MSLLEEIRTENPLRVIISLLVGTAALERTLGDVSNGLLLLLSSLVSVVVMQC